MIKEEVYNRVINRIEEVFQGMDIKIGYKDYSSYFTKDGNFDKRRSSFSIQFYVKHDDSVINLVELLEHFYSNIKVIIKEYENEILFSNLTSSGYIGNECRSIVYSLRFMDYSFFAKKKLQK